MSVLEISYYLCHCVFTNLTNNIIITLKLYLLLIVYRGGRIFVFILEWAPSKWNTDFFV